MAGGKTKPAWQEQGIEHPSLADVNGIPMISRVVSSFVDAGVTDTIVLTGVPKIAEMVADCCQVIADEGDIIRNIESALRAAKNDLIILSSSDLPCLTSKVARDWLEQCRRENDIDFIYPIASLLSCQKAFPGVKRTTIPVRDGSYTGGNILMVRRNFLLANLDLARCFFESRKNPLALAKLLGYWISLRLVLKMLIHWFPLAPSIHQLEVRFGQIAHCRVKTLKCDPIIATDADTPEQLTEILEIVKRGGV